MMMAVLYLSVQQSKRMKFFKMSNRAQNIKEPYMHIAKWKRAMWKPYGLHDSNYKLWQTQNHGDSKRIGGCHGAWGEGGTEGAGGAHGIFRAVQLFCLML